MPIADLLLGIVLLGIVSASWSQAQLCSEADEVAKSFRVSVNSTDLKCNSNGHVEQIVLVGKNLSGHIHLDLSKLPSLVHVNLTNNNISVFDISAGKGSKLKVLNLSCNSLFSLPDGLLELSSLEHLDLSRNFLNGKIPQLQALRYLNLSINNFTGNVELGASSVLEELDLSYNNFTSPIPTQLFQFKALQYLSLEKNYFTGPLPPGAFEQLRNLTYLILSDNKFTGEIPRELANCSQLVQLDLSRNQFFGGLPPELGKLGALRVLAAGENNLNGTLDFASGSFESLESIYLTQNNFAGALPSSLGNLRKLKKLVLSKNSFNGPIPSELANCTQLEEIWLNDNNLTGPIPIQLCNLTELHYLAINNNTFSGAIPAGLSNCKRLQVLWLEQNSFTGKLPSTFGDLSELLMLSVSGNQLTGTVPANYSKLKNLIGLDVGWNNFSGEIPSALAGLSALQFLFLSNNKFNGSVPNWLSELKKLRALDFSFNKLTGSIPSNIDGLPTLQTVSRYNSSSPSAWVHTAEGLVYQGFALPTTIDLSHNQLSGSIPTEIGRLQNLQVLDLSGNNLSGSIPKELGDAKSLLKLNLSHNGLNGTIPPSLTKLSFLTSLDLSYNSLKGQIPSSTQFSTFPVSSFEGNKLCGGPLKTQCNSLPPYDIAPQSGTKSKTLRKILPVLMAVCGAVFFCGFMAMYFALARKRQKLYSNGEGCERNFDFSVTFCEKLPELCPKKIAAATNNYNQANIVGDGGFGVVYRAVLESGAVVAVKKLSSGGLQGDREFHAELQTLGDLKHKNLVPLLGFCSNGSDRLLIYKYLKNGSLDTWLYCREPGMKPLDWPTRLKIARGAAQGIAYLHQGGDHSDHPAIIHRDIKVSNILLDEDFEAHVADFGLARLVNVGDTHVSTDVAGTIGYIPPEYSHKCCAQPKGDVYSFGVVCLEILTAKRPTDQFFRKTGVGHLVAWIQSMKSLEEYRMALDSTLVEGENGSLISSSDSNRSVEQMLDMMWIACSCCRETPSKRPSMQEVASLLEKLEKRVLMPQLKDRGVRRCSSGHVEMVECKM